MGLNDLSMVNYVSHFTPDIATEIIIKYLKDITDYFVFDLFVGTGDLVVPILQSIPFKERVDFFKENVLLSDIDKSKLEILSQRLKLLGIGGDDIRRRLLLRDNLKDRLQIKTTLKKLHITNPPFMYKGTAAKYYPVAYSYFSGEKSELQDLYQIALYHDIVNQVDKMIYILPQNFVFSENKEIKHHLLQNGYGIDRAIFVDEMFKDLAVRCGIFFFSKNQKSCFDVYHLSDGTKTHHCLEKRIEYDIKYHNGYFKFYLNRETLLNNPGPFKITAINTNFYDKGKRSYKKEVFYVNSQIEEYIRRNNLFLKTIDSSIKIGLYDIRSVFGVDTIVYQFNTSRCSPIPVFFDVDVDYKQVIERFNEEVNSLRDTLRNFKQSKNYQKRKFLTLTHAKQILYSVIQKIRAENTAL